MIVKPSAQIDIDEAFTWYEETLDNLGFEFLLSLDAAIESIRRNPEFAGYAHDAVRSVALTRFPFSVFYVVEDSAIFILAVIHYARNPEEWKRRI